MIHMDYYAHSLPGSPPQAGWELLADHLRDVAARAESLATDVASPNSSLSIAARSAGLLHDLGKYRTEFQEYIRGCRAKGDPLTHHKQAGAARAFAANQHPIAFAIAGHHGGMPDLTDLRQAVKGSSGHAVVQDVRQIAEWDCPEIATVSLSSPLLGPNPLAWDLFTRLLFSCLVDADWTATGEFERKAHNRPPEPAPPRLEPETRLVRLEAFINERAKVVGETIVGKIRAEVLADCHSAAERTPGVFTLTVPTGGGKTLSGLAFALRHAAKHGLRRVIYVAPFLSIIEQNADVIRQALGVENDDPDVFEHHSLAEPPGDDTDEKAREAAARRAENWDAPVVVTTNVQFFESLFANKPGRCRKLHNIARSVILLDECQALPPGLVAPTCQMLKQVAESFGSSVVLCTATQPAFDHPKLGSEALATSEIIQPQRDLFTRLKRVELVWPSGNDDWLSWAEVATRMLDTKKSALCVVNTKKAARAVFDELKKRGVKGVFHLSTAMCPAHRLAHLNEIRTRLKEKKPTYLASTQLIEAGVDVSFPVVLRELGPLEGIIQAAGRCNREGEIPDSGGRVIVFRSEKQEMPPGWYTTGWDKVTQALRLNKPPRIDVPGDIRDYYERLYNSGSLDEQDVIAKRRGFLFESVAKAYELIDDAGRPVVVMNWGQRQTEIDGLIERVRNPMTRNRRTFRAIARFQVNIRFWEVEKLQSQGLVCPLDPDIDLLGWFGDYNSETGLVSSMPDQVLIG